MYIFTFNKSKWYDLRRELLFYSSHFQKTDVFAWFFHLKYLKSGPKSPCLTLKFRTVPDNRVEF